jgi:hypothetical protein
MWAHKLTKNRRHEASLPPFCICLCSKPFFFFTVTLQSLWIPARTELITSLWQLSGATWCCHPPSEDSYPSNPLKQKPDYSLQMITFQNWTRPILCSPPVLNPLDWHCSSSHNYTCDCDYLTMYTLVPRPQFFCLFKPYVYTLKIAKDELSAYSASSHSKPWGM